MYTILCSGRSVAWYRASLGRKRSQVQILSPRPFFIKCVSEGRYMKSKVYFSKEISGEAVLKLFKHLNKELPGKVAIKLHSGEQGNQNYLKPAFWKPIIDYVKGTVVECNTAYPGARNSTK